MRRDTIRLIDGYPCEVRDPIALLLGAKRLIDKVGDAKTDEEGDALVAEAAGRLVAYLEWKPK